MRPIERISTEDLKDYNGERLAADIDALEAKLEELGDLAGVPYQTLTRWKNENNPTWKRRMKIKHPVILGLAMEALKRRAGVP